MAELHTFDPAGDLLLQLSKVEYKKITEGEHEDEYGVQDDQHEDGFTEEHITIHLKTSSRHLMLASPVFAAMLQQNFKEGEEFKARGYVEIPLPDDDAEAFIIMMNVVHGRNRAVPKLVNLRLLANIAILADKYQMLEVMKSCTTVWIKHLRAELPDRYDNHHDAAENPVHIWAGIAWIFGDTFIFEDMTYMIHHKCTSRIEDSLAAFPLPEIVISTISQVREGTLLQYYNFVEHVIKQYKSGKPICRRTDGHGSACDSIFLNSLLKSSIEMKVYPAPKAPFEGASIDDVSRSISSLDVTFLCDTLAPAHISHEIEFWDLWKDLRRNRNEFCGLILGDYKNRVVGKTR